MSKQLAKWDSVGILLTYWCNAACAHCYENSSPRCRHTMSLDQVRDCLRQLRQLGCKGAALHFAGGEPFYDYGLLIDSFKAARDEGLLPLGKLETNAFWCTDDDLVRQRLTEIRDLGLIELLISSDVFHQEFIPIERVQRAVRIGREVLGDQRVRVRSSEFLQNPIDPTTLTNEQRDDAFRCALIQREERMLGRAARALSHLVDRHPKEAFANTDCHREILLTRHFHIDPYGHIFPCVCAGLILGNVKTADLATFHETFNCDERPVSRTLIDHGPLPLFEEALRHGLQEDPAGYASQCHLCYEARTFFRRQGMYPDEIGPDEIYAAD